MGCECLKGKVDEVQDFYGASHVMVLGETPALNTPVTKTQKKNEKKTY